MLYKGIEFKAIIFTILAMLGAVNLSVLTNTTTLAQAQPDSAKISRCIGIKIKLYIQQANNGSSSAFNKLVACNSRAIPYLVQALESKDENLRIISIAAIGEIDANAAALPYLTKSLKDTSKDVRVVTAYALGNIGKDAVPALITALKDENNNVRGSAVDALGNIGKDAVPALTTALKDKNSNVRDSAAYALGQIGKDAACLNCVNRIVSRFRESTLVHLRNKPPVMCSIPIINNLLNWKCSNTNSSENTPLNPSQKPENLPQLMQRGNSPDRQKPCKNCSNSQDEY